VRTIDLHPEEMLDAARRGTLGGAAAQDLRAHLARCAACRASLTLPDELAAEAAVTSADDALLASMVRGALRGEPRVATEGRPHRAHGGAGRRVAVALALLLLGGSGGAAVWSMGGATFARRVVPEILQLKHRAEPARPAPSRVDVPAHDSAPEIVPLAPALPVGAALEPPEAPAPPLAPAHLARIHVPLPPPRATAAELFADANRARREGDVPLALRRYAELGRSYPGSREELTSRVVVGDLLLVEGPTRDALRSYDSYLAASPTGTLAEEALVGRAVALMRLGRRDEERAAWTKLLREHPDSVQNDRARRRLAELR
jgi:TolA-binding protein